MFHLPFTLTPAETAMIVTLLGKWFIMAADAMPAPPANCGYFVRWGYDFIQHLASNSAKVGNTGTTKQPAAQ
jgi:hypothetical protein